MRTGKPAASHAAPAIGAEPADALVEHVDVPGTLIRERRLLRELQRSDLSLLAAYRQIPLLTGRVQRLAYTRARTRTRRQT